MSTSRVIAVLPSAAQTITGVVALGALPGEYQELTAYIDVTAVAGTTPSMVVTYQISPDNVAFYDHTAGVAITAAGRQSIRIPANIGVFGRLSYAITGTAPSFTFSASVEVKRA